MDANFSTALLAYSSVLLWFFTSVVFFSISGVFKDKLLLLYAAAFFLIGIARGINILDTGVLDGFHLFIVLALRAVASFLLIVGSINGSRQHKNTPLVLAGVLTVSVISATVFKQVPQSIGPLPLALSLGFIFAALRFWTGEKRDLGAEVPYNIFAVLFAIKGAQALVIPFVGTDSPFALYVLVAEMLTLLAMVAAVFYLAFVRHRISMSCQREIIGN